MRILVVAHGYPPRAPGVWSVHLVRWLATRHSVWVYARCSDDSLPPFHQWDERDPPAGIRYVASPVGRPGVGDERRASVDERFASFLDEVRPDVVHFEHLVGLSATLPAITRERGVPSVLALYDHWLICPAVHLVRRDGSPCPGPSLEYDCVRCVEGGEPGPAEGWRRLVQEGRLAVLRSLAGEASVMTACSDHLRNFMTEALDLPPGRIRHVELGFPPLDVPQPESASDRLRVGYLGSVSPHKGVHVLSQAVARLGDSVAELHVHGPVQSDYEPELRASGAPIVFHGSYQRDTLGRILSGLDVVAVPSLAPETFSIVIREAAMAHVPVVASRIGAIPEFVRDGETGLLVSPGNVTELADALARLAADPDLRERLSASPAPVRTVEDYGSEMEALYVELARNGRASS